MPSLIDYGNPLTSGLVAAYVFTDGNAINLVSGSDTLTLTGDASLSASGLEAPNSGSLTGAILASPPSSFQSAAVTLFWRGQFHGDGTIGNNPPLVSMFHNDTNASPFISYGLNRRNPVQDALYGLYSEGSNSHNISMSAVIDTGAGYDTPVSYILTRTSGATGVYKNGTLIGADSVSGAISYGATPALAINRHITVTGDSANTNTELVFIWDRVLTSGEIADLTANPRFFLASPDPLIGAASGTFAFGADAAGAISIIGRANGVFWFGGEAVGVANLTGAAVGDFEFRGAAAGRLSIIASASGDFVFGGAVEVDLSVVPAECITSDGVKFFATAHDAPAAY
jgi:hypothetical protein